MPLKAWEMLIRISEYLGGPQTVSKGGQYLAPGYTRLKLGIPRAGQILPVM